MFHIAVTFKRIKNGKYSQRSRPGQTSIDKYHRFPGHDDMMRDCFIRSVFTALTLPEISFLIPVFQLVLVYRLLPFCLFMWPRVHHDRGSERGSRRVLRDKHGDSYVTRDSFVSIRHLALRVFEPK